MKWLFALVALGGLGGCKEEPLGAEVLSFPPSNTRATLAVGADGRSEPFAFRVASRARSFTIVARGADDRLYALDALIDASGVDHVQADPTILPASIMQHQFADEEVGFMPGPLLQVVRLGEFVHVYPYAPGQSFPPGWWELRLACDRPGGTVDVMVDLPSEDAARTLHLNLFTISDDPMATAARDTLPAVAAILAQAKLSLVVDEERRLTGTAFSKLDEMFGTNPGPQSELAALAREGRKLVSSAGLDVFVVDSFSFPLVRGASLGLPGGPDPASYYFGVFVRNDPDPVKRARTMAHEISHFLALQHVENISSSGTVYRDPYDDTLTGQGNLMDTGDGTLLSAGQSFALTKSALLRNE